MHESEKWKWSHSVVSDSWWPHGLQPTRLLHPWDFPGKSTGVGCHCLLHKTNLRPSKSHKSSFKRACPAAKLGTTLAFLVEVGRHLVDYGRPGMLQTSPLALALPWEARPFLYWDVGGKDSLQEVRVTRIEKLHKWQLRNYLSFSDSAWTTS